MAVLGYFGTTTSTSVIWGQPSATGVTKNMTLDALASLAARMGVYADLGATWEQSYAVQIVVETGTAPTAGKQVTLWFACSMDGSTWPGGVDGTDAAYRAGDELEWAAQLGPQAAALTVTADGNTVQRGNYSIWYPSGRYVAPVLYNGMNQAFRDETTGTDNDSRIILVPLRSLIQDT